MSQTRPKQIAQEGATPGQSLVWDGSEWTPTNDRLTETGDPSFGGVPGALTYTLSRDEIITFSDSGIAEFATLTITLPPIASCLPGERVGLRLFSGNPISSVIFVPGISDAIINPETLAFSGPPGTGFTLSQGSVSGYSTFVWEAVDTGTALVWFFVYDTAGGGGGGGGGTYEATLAAGQDSGALGRYLNTGSKAVMGTDVASAPTPAQAAGALKSYQFEGSFFTGVLSGGGEGAGTYVLNTEIFENTSGSQFDGIAIVEWWVFRYATAGFNPQTLRGYGTAKETWNISFVSSRVGAQRIPDVTQQSGFDIARVAPGVSPRSIAIEILDGGTAGTPLSAKVYYKITFSNNTTAF